MLTANQKTIMVPPQPRPNFGKRQIRNLDQIFKDQLILICNHDDDDDNDHRVKARVIRGPYKCNKNWCLDYEYRHNGESEQNTIILADYSVIRDNNRSWNLKNWLEKG